jgi:hypothetical protein
MMDIRPIEPGDEAALLRFFDRIPESGRAVLDALEMRLAKLVVEVIADQEALVGMFRTLGFEPEALLTDHVRDRAGELRGLMVLASSVEGHFASMAAAGSSTASDRLAGALPVAPDGSIMSRRITVDGRRRGLSG